MRMPNYIVFPPFIAIFFLYHNKKKRVPFLLTTCNWLQAIHFLELFLSFRNRHFLLRSNLISLSCLRFSLKFKHSQVIVICWNYAFLLLSKLCFWNHLIFLKFALIRLILKPKCCLLFQVRTILEKLVAVNSYYCLIQIAKIVRACHFCKLNGNTQTCLQALWFVKSRTLSTKAAAYLAACSIKLFSIHCT